MPKVRTLQRHVDPYIVFLFLKTDVLDLEWVAKGRCMYDKTKYFGKGIVKSEKQLVSLYSGFSFDFCWEHNPMLLRPWDKLNPSTTSERGTEFEDPWPSKLAHAPRDVQFHASCAAQPPAASVQHLWLSVESLADLALSISHGILPPRHTGCSGAWAWAKLVSNLHLLSTQRRIWPWLRPTSAKKAESPVCEIRSGILCPQL